MRKIVALAIKDVLLRFSSASELLFFLVLPILFTFSLGGGFGAGPGPSEKVLWVVNEDNSSLAQELISTIDQSTAVRVESKTLAEAEKSFGKGDILAYIVIPAGFEQTVQNSQAATVAIWQTPLNSDAMAVAQVVQTAVSHVGQAYSAALLSTNKAEEIRPFASPAERQTYFDATLAKARTQLANEPSHITITVPDTAPVQDNAAATKAHQSAGQLVTWVLIPLLGTSALFASERSKGTLRRLLTTPTSKSIFLLGTIVGQLSIAIVQMLLLILFGTFVMKLNWGNSPLGLALMIVSFGLAAVALGTMLGTFVQNEAQASSLSIMFGMSMALLGGCWWPIELFPSTVRTVVQILPTSWAMQGFSDLVVRGLGASAVLPETAVLLAFAVVFFVVGVSRFRFE